jgi:hypothetical protein
MKNMPEPIVDQLFLLEKYPGKSGWTYARIPGISPSKGNGFGWVRVRGSIDNFYIKSYHLAPMGNGQLFLPVKAAIRKLIGKKEGDYVHVVLYHDDLPVDIPEELKLCLLDEPGAYQAFTNAPIATQKSFIDWIYSAKKEETKINRIANSIDMLLKGQTLTAKAKQQNE